MSEAVYWLKVVVILLVVGWMIFWGLRQARHPREALRGSWWPLAPDEPTWPVVVMGWFGVGFAVLALTAVLYAAIAHIR